MEDKEIMENLLHLKKGACDLYMHGTIESGTQNVNQVFSSALTETLALQKEISSKMSQKGWYPTDQAEQQKMQQVKQQYSMK